jgi:inner membrane protein
VPTFISHAISGLAAASLTPVKSSAARVTLLCLFCAVAPDLDAIGFRSGVPYHHWLGHRGFSHSLLFAVILALFASLFVPAREKSVKTGCALFSAFFSCALLHDLLDAMTNGGLGIAFLSPFSETRFFLPWRPIEVSPMSLKRLFSARGSVVLASEFFSVIMPSLLLMAFGQWRRRKSAIRGNVESASATTSGTQ